MNEIINYVNNNLFPSLIVSLFPSLLGISISSIDKLVDSRKTFRERIKLLKSNRLEELSIKLVELLNHARKIHADNILRGDGKEEPDLVNDYNTMVIKTISVFVDCDNIYEKIRKLFSIIIYTIFIPLISVIFILLNMYFRIYIFMIAIILVVIQVICIIRINNLSNNVDEYE